MSRAAPSAAAAPARAVLAIAAAELRLSARRGETLLLTLGIPVAVLALFATLGIVPVEAGGRAVDRLLPGTIALAVIATSFVGLGIATAYDRFYGVLKRLGGSPLTRGELLLGKLVAVLVVEAVQVGLLVTVAIAAFGWAAPGDVSIGLAVVAIGLGTLAFAGLGLLLAGLLRAETMLAVANGLFVVFLGLGGIVLPIERLPDALGAVAAALPASALTEALSIALGAGAGAEGGVGGDPSGALALLAGWGVVTSLLAIRTFRWE